jgi:HPt (histidine-containing phosphotransfer) domain-containing protein
MNSELNMTTSATEHYVDLILKEIRTDYPSIKESKVFELKELDSTLDLFQKLVAIFQNEANKRVPEMNSAAMANDFKTVGHVTHRFRSTAFNLGALRAAELTKKIDFLIGKAVVNTGDLLQLIAALDQECIIASNELKTYLR